MELRAIDERMDEISAVSAGFNTGPFPIFVVGEDSCVVFPSGNSLAG